MLLVDMTHWLHRNLHGYMTEMWPKPKEDLYTSLLRITANQSIATQEITNRVIKSLTTKAANLSCSWMQAIEITT